MYDAVTVGAEKDISAAVGVAINGISILVSPVINTAVKNYEVETCNMRFPGSQ